MPSRSGARHFFARTCSPRRAFRPTSAHACLLGPVDGNRYSVRKGSIPRFSEPDAACRLLQRLRRASTPQRAFDPHPRGRPRSPPRCAAEVLRSVKSRACCDRGRHGAGRELVSEGLARVRAPLLIVAPEHPGRWIGTRRDWRLPFACRNPAKTCFRHRPAKGGDFRRVEVLSTDSELRCARIAPRARTRLPLTPLLTFVREHCSRKSRLLFRPSGASLW